MAACNLGVHNRLAVVLVHFRPSCLVKEGFIRIKPLKRYSIVFYSTTIHYNLFGYLRGYSSTTRPPRLVPLRERMRSSESYMAPQPSFNAVVPPPANPTQLDSTSLAAAQAESQTYSSSVVTPSILVLSARLAMLFCNKCQKRDISRKSAEEKQPNSKSNLQLPSGPQHCLHRNSRIPNKIIGNCRNKRRMKIKALFDSGSSESFIHPSLVEAAAITIHPSSRTVSMATSAFSRKVTGYCIVNLTYQGWVYTKAFIYLYYQDSTLTLSWDSRSSHSMKALLLIMVVRNHPCLSLVYIKYRPASTVCNPDCRLSSHRH